MSSVLATAEPLREDAVGVLGGGVIGASIAWAMAQRGQRVTILEGNSHLGREASSAAIGGITPVTDDFCRAELRLLSKLSTDIYTAWLEDLSRSSGLNIPYLDTGILYAGLTEEEWQNLKGPFAGELSALGVDFAVAEGTEVQELDNRLSPGIYGAIHIPIEGAVEPAVVMHALESVLSAANNVRVIYDCKITEIREEAACVTVISTQGCFSFPTAVVSLGHRSHSVLDRLAPLMVDVRGQAVEMRAVLRSEYPLKFHVYAHLPQDDLPPSTSAYVVPRSDGRLVAGVTYEPHQDQVGNTVVGVQRILDAAVALCPVVRNWELIRMWSGIRPGTVDRRPIIGYWSSQRRLLLATGHFGLGVTLAPVTARIVSEMLGYADAEITRDFDMSPLGLTDSRIRAARRV